MSRIGKSPITIPKGVEVKIGKDEVSVKGPKGALSQAVHPDMTVEINDDILTVTRPTDNKLHRSFHGLTRTLINNMVKGTSEGFQKNLEIVGVGYRVQASGNDKLNFSLGFSHPVEYVAPEGITFAVEGTNKITVSGIDKELVGRVASQIRALRPPDHYKGKGVRYAGEYVRLKAGKSGKVGARK